jgi:hypothetical protein
MHHVCDFRARGSCTFVHVGVTASGRCKVCEWMKQFPNVAGQILSQSATCRGLPRCGGVLLSAACLDGRVAEFLEGDQTYFELW